MNDPRLLFISLLQYYLKPGTTNDTLAYFGNKLAGIILTLAINRVLSLITITILIQSCDFPLPVITYIIMQNHFPLTVKGFSWETGNATI